MSKFYVPKRFDASTADEGQWTGIYDTEGTHYGDFKLKYLEPRTTQYELAYKRVRTKYANELRTKKLKGVDIDRVCLVEIHLLDWKLPTDPSDPKAKSVPFSVEAAHEYFKLEDTLWILSELIRFTEDPSNFKGPDVEPTVEEISGN